MEKNTPSLVSLVAVLGLGCASSRTDQTPTESASAEPSITAVHLEQRHTSVVSFVERQVSLSLGDITSGKVSTRLVEASTGKELVNHSFAVGDLVPFELDARVHYLGLSRLENRTFGPDDAVFHLGSRSEVVDQQVQHLLDYVAHRDRVQFALGERACDPAEFAAALGARWDEREWHDVASFLDEIAGDPPEGSTEFAILLGDHAVPFDMWFRKRPPTPPLVLPESPFARTAR